MTSTDLTKVAVRLLIAVLCGGALLLILLITSSTRLDETSGKAIGTAVAVAFFSLTAVAGTLLVDRRSQLSAFGYLTVTLSAVAFLVMAVSIWGGDLSGDNWQPAIYTLIAAFAAGHVSILLSSVREGEAESLTQVRIGTIAALGVLVTMGYVEISAPGHDVDAQLFGIVAVLYALGAIVFGLLRRTGPTQAPTPVVVAEGEKKKEEEAGIVELPVDHLCLAWNSTVDEAIAYLDAYGHDVVAGPVARLGAHGQGQSLYFHDDDGRLVELIAYK
jgi:hypothetical protein